MIETSTQYGKGRNGQFLGLYLIVGLPTALVISICAYFQRNSYPINDLYAIGFPLSASLWLLSAVFVFARSRHVASRAVDDPNNAGEQGLTNALPSPLFAVMVLSSMASLTGSLIYSLIIGLVVYSTSQSNVRYQTQIRAENPPT